MNFRISYIKLVNHVVLGNIETFIDNDIVSIMGRNGSGKSFLIDTLHPYSKSTRFVSTYPVKKGEVGYKQINFEFPDGIVYETIHEYQPKGKTHSCKSYLNKIENGVKLELNPTGHCEKYDELITKHLNATAGILNIGFISFKANGITGSKGTERKAVLETTIDSDTLKTYKKNVRSLLNEYNAFAKQYERKKLALAALYTESSLDDDYSDLEARKYNSEVELETVTTRFHELTHRLAELDKLRNLDVNKITQLYNIAIELNGSTNKNIMSIYHELQGYQSEAEKVSDRITRLDTDISLIKRSDAIKASLVEFKEKLDTIHKDLENHTSDLNKYVNDTDSVKLDEWLTKIIYYASEFTSRLKCIGLASNMDENTFSVLIEDLTKEKSDMSRFVAKYDLAANSTDGEKYDIVYNDICGSCVLYDKFVKSEQFVVNNRDKYNQVTRYDLPEIEQKVNLLTITKADIDSSVRNLVTDISTHLTTLSIDTIGVRSITDFLAQCSNGTLQPKLSKLKNWIADKRDIIEQLKTDEVNMTNKIAAIQEHGVEFTTTNSLSDLVSERDALRDKVRELDNILSNETNIMIMNLNINDPVISEYIVKTFDDLITIYNMMSKNNTYYNELKHELDKVTDRKNELPGIINNLFASMIENRHKLNELQEINTSLLNYDKSRGILQKCKDVIEKDIPLALLQNNLKFIEDSTNNILSANDINMSVNIISTDKEIIIEVSMKDKVVEDATQLSDGETCIMSLLLNACVLNIIGYPILCLDEIDANLDTVMKSKFNDLVCTIMSTLNISQVICISHNVASGINFSTKLLLGSSEGLEVLQQDAKIIKL